MACSTDLTCADWQQRLRDAETARHNLLLGKGVQSVTYGDMQTSYSKADIGALEAYIAELRETCDSVCGTSTRRHRHSLRFIPLH